MTKRFRIATIGSLLACLLLAGCSSGNTTNGSVGQTPDQTGGSEQHHESIEFYQSKGEAVEFFNQVIADFQKEYPNIQVTQINRPNDPTYLKSRAAADDLPDVMSGSFNSGELSSMIKSDLLKDLTNTPQAATIIDSYKKQVIFSGGTDSLYGYPAVANVRGVLYNKKMFQDAGYQVPTTWDEFISLCKAIKEKNTPVTALTFGYKDSWTLFPPVDQLAAFPQVEFFEGLRAGSTTFTDPRFQSVLDKLLELIPFGNNNLLQYNYDQANAAFANGKSYMYIQGNWAVPAIKAQNPNTEIGFFALPASNNPDETVAAGNTDVMYLLSKHSKHSHAAETFVNFLIRPDNVQKLALKQSLLPTVQGVPETDPVLNEMLKLVNNGKVNNPFANVLPSGFDPFSILQEFVVKKDKETATRKLQQSMDKATKKNR